MTIAPTPRPAGRKFAVLVLLAVGFASGPARAEDQIKPGQWEFHVQVAMPNMPKLPPGVQLPRGVQMGAGGMTVTHTSCVTNANPIPPDGHGPKPGAHDDQCKVGKIDRAGGSISWVIDCQTPQNTSHTEGTAHYAGDTMEATFKTRVKQGAVTNETSQHVTGHYVGPCEK